MKFLIVLGISLVASQLQPTSGSSEGISSSGVPCYLHPSTDGCHYRLRPGSDFCTTASEKKRLGAELLLLNRTLTSLEQQLIRLGIIPADNACSQLPPVTNGGILYSDLNLSPGTSARYICDVGYILQPIHQRYEFNCTEDGIWNGNVTQVPVECLTSPERCDPPEDMLLGNITYANGDPSNILVGDIITYSCEPGTDLRGPSKRFCQRSGNWTGSDPECVAKDDNRNESISGNHMKEAIGAGVGTVTAVVITLVVVVVIIFYKCRSPLKRKLMGYSSHVTTTPNLVVSDSIGDVHASVHTSSDPSVRSAKAALPDVEKKQSRSSYRSTRQTFDEINL